jgi:low affinity Fe/Cu permease
LALLVILIWIATGPAFHYSNTCQLIINTGTTIVTVLIVFLIQNTQNLDAKAMQLKLDEIIRAVEGARNELLDLENCSEEDMKQLEEQLKRIRQRSERDVSSDNFSSLEEERSRRFKLFVSLRRDRADKDLELSPFLFMLRLEKAAGVTSRCSLSSITRLGPLVWKTWMLAAKAQRKCLLT